MRDGWRIFWKLCATKTTRLTKFCNRQKETKSLKVYNESHFYENWLVAELRPVFAAKFMWLIKG
jgi:hypothetical protein